MNRGELRAAVREELLEPTPARWTDAQLNRYLNEILLDLAQVSRTEVQAAPVTVAAGTVTFALPSNVLIPTALVWVEGGSRYRVRWANAPVALNADATGTPCVTWLEGQTVRLWPTPAANGQVIVKGIRRPAQLASDTDVPELVDADEALIAGTVWKAYESDYDHQREVWGARYIAAKAAFAEAELRRNPQVGRVRDVYDEGEYLAPLTPWDFIGW